MKKRNKILIFINLCYMLFTFCASEESKFQRKVDAFFTAKDYSSALKYIDSYIQENPEKPFARKFLVKALCESGDVSTASIEYGRFYSLTKKHDQNLLWSLVTEIIRYPDQKFRKAASMLLGDLGDKKAVPLLQERLKDEDWFVRLVAVESLSKLGDKSNISILHEAVKKSDYTNTINQAAQLLGEFKDTTAVPILHELLKGYVAPGIAAESLIKIGDRSIINTLKDWLKDEEYGISGIYFIAKLEDEISIPILQEVFNDKNKSTYMRLLASEVLLKHGYKNAIQIIEETLKDKDDKNRYLAAKILANIGDKSCLPLLKNLLKEEDEGFRHIAAEGIGRLGDKEQIQGMLKDKNNEIKKLGIIALNSLEDKDEIPGQRELLKDPSEEIRSFAALTLGMRGDKSVIPILKDMIKNENSKRYSQISTSEVLARLGDKSPFYIKLLDYLKADPYYAAKLLGVNLDHSSFEYFKPSEFIDKGDLPMFCELLINNNFEVRITVILGVLRILYS